jgi:hypothetical protein
MNKQELLDKAEELMAQAKLLQETAEGMEGNASMLPEDDDYQYWFNGAGLSNPSISDSEHCWQFYCSENKGWYSIQQPCFTEALYRRKK